MTLAWPAKTELVGITFDVAVSAPVTLSLQYTVGLHAWFLDQVRQSNPELSAYMHDDKSEKPFNVSGLEGAIALSGRQIELQPEQTYQWHVHALSKPVADWLKKWLKSPPPVVELRQAPLTVQGIRISLPPMTYAQLRSADNGGETTVRLSFLSPTSFRRKGHHLPFPWPSNVFHSYLRRWNNFSGDEVDAESFLQWVDESVIIQAHRIESMKVAVGKKGSVTGFMGVVEFGLDRKARENEMFTQLFYTLARLAPYYGTGHKTTFGLGQTRLGWAEDMQLPVTVAAESLLGDRIAELTERFMEQRKRQGGDRARKTAETWATILARREMGEPLMAIAEDMELNYETAKTYVKLARRASKEEGGR